MRNPRTLALFCKVVDNFGDIGICWRLSRQLQREHGIAVTLWVDDLKSFRRLCPDVVPDADAQHVQGIEVRHWRDQDGAFAPEEIPDIVIEFFGCELPPAYVAAMAQCEPRPVWLNLEGLTAEEWVEGCHGLPSMHPRLPLTKHFFFPGFTAKTGGLLREAGLDEARQRFQSDPAAMQGFLGQLGVSPAEMAAMKVSLFCYPHAPVADLFAAWSDGGTAVTCLVPEGVATAAVQSFLGGTPRAGAVHAQGALTVRVIPFLPQPDYDRLLWACDLNFVRGEDSFVRAQWAQRPFVWHIYPQDENLHHKKLRAFLQRYASGLDGLEAFSLEWNGATAQQAWPQSWDSLRADLAGIERRAVEWSGRMQALGNLTSGMLAFAATLREPVRA
ncbi:elongation factor P maturation arginine rhamnosyltransferase EarP [Noviherbaspirillum aridicola]|uniref:Protein-arginine rhamnosyltransferase n=1 Tax=Noviherbaspirillum aridicola TaxID=2849687 RepID=A0ABQ4Q4N9_9BURK|nr:elongation factor P maturation arginine rhamnosyltransferase EarP [Noviherbaspirillum aridicola]GIZ52158.1 hypothetical protein NCCP691_21720 [Noviherbaspirillum aridicola]